MTVIQQLIVREQREQANRILKSLPTQGGGIALLGEARFGKSNILRYIAEQIKTPYILVSLASFDNEMQLYNAIREKLLQYLPDSASVLTGNPANPQSEMNQLLSKLHEKLQIITLIIDDADFFSTEEWGLKAFLHLSYLSNLYAVRVILAGSEGLKVWAENLRSKSLWENLNRPMTHLFGIAPLFIDEECKYKPYVAQRLKELCGGHPYCLWQVADGDILDNGFSKQDILEKIDLRERQLSLDGEWHELFHEYWITYSLATRSLCYLLSTSPNGMQTIDALKNALCSHFTDGEISAALDSLERTAVLIPDETKTQLQLIGVFAHWYKTISGYLDNLRPEMLLPTNIIFPEESLSTELTFLLEEDLVVIQRGHYHSFTKMGSKNESERFLIDFPDKCIETQDVEIEKFRRKITRLSRDLRREFGDLDWFTTVVQAADLHHSLQFIIPEKLMGFPWELLPIDDTGTRQIGAEVPISRHLLKQGRYVDQPPLRFPLPNKQRLRVLVVAAEVKSPILVDMQGCVNSSVSPNGEDFFLSRLQLDNQINALQSAFNFQPDLVDATYLTFETNVPNSHPATTVEFETILRSQQFDLLHFAGHGIYSDSFKGLVFADGAISLQKLNGLLEGQQQLRFVFLNCCEGARTNPNPFVNNLLGLAQTCIEAGVPAVASMRWSIPVGVADVLAKAFYPAFFSEGLLDKAMLSAIKEIKKQVPDLNVFALAPVLLMH